MNFKFQLSCLFGKNAKKLMGMSLVMLLSCGFCFAAAKEEQAKKRILVLISKGGACHLSAFCSLQSFLGNEYELIGCDLVEELCCLDPIKKITCGRLNGEGFYNLLLRGGWTNLTSFLVEELAPSLIKNNYKGIEAGVLDLLNRTKPDMLLSLIPFFNFPACRAAETSGIPFLLVTLDSDLTIWLDGMEKGITHHTYGITTGSSLKVTQDQLKKAGIPEERVHRIGFPLREAFFGKKIGKGLREAIDKELRETIAKNLREALVNKEIDKKSVTETSDDKFTIMLLMGGAGSGTMYDYVKAIDAMACSSKIHLFVCAGRNEALEYDLEKLKYQLKSVSISILPFLNEAGIRDYMSLSDLLITKTGPGSINEAIQMGLPMILDATGTVLTWERPNIQFVEQNRWGMALYSFEDLEMMINVFMNKRFQKCMSEHFKNRQYIFNDKLKELILNLLQEQEKHSR